MIIDEDLLFDMLNEVEVQPLVQPPKKKLAQTRSDLFFKGKKFVFTGAFGDRTRDELERATEQYGGKVLKAVSGNTDFLVVADSSAGNSTKAESARRKGIPVMSETEWKHKEAEFLHGI